MNKLLLIVMLFSLVGCGDAVDEPEVIPETRIVKLGSLDFRGSRLTDEIAFLPFSVEGHDFDRSEVCKVSVRVVKDGMSVKRIDVFDDEISTMRDVELHEFVIDGIPMEAIAGSEQKLRFTIRGGAWRVKLEVIAEILK